MEEGVPVAVVEYEGVLLGVRLREGVLEGVGLPVPVALTLAVALGSVGEYE